MMIDFDKIHEFEQNIDKHIIMKDSYIVLTNFNNKPIKLWLISYKTLLLFKNEYIKFFNKYMVDYILQSSGAASFNTPECYSIFINIDIYKNFDINSKNFIIAHEIGHIINGDLDENSSVFGKREKENRADAYARRLGFKLLVSPFKLTLWEIYSLIPRYSHKELILIFFFRVYLYLKHLFPNFIRVSKNRC